MTLPLFKIVLVCFASLVVYIFLPPSLILFICLFYLNLFTSIFIVKVSKYQTSNGTKYPKMTLSHKNLWTQLSKHPINIKKAHKKKIANSRMVKPISFFARKKYKEGGPCVYVCASSEYISVYDIIISSYIAIGRKRATGLSSPYVREFPIGFQPPPSTYTAS